MLSTKLNTVMANILNLTVVTSSPSSNGGHILKLQSKSSKSQMTPFGLKKVDSQSTFYMKVENPCTVGMVAPMDIDLFDVVSRDFTPDDANPGDAPLQLKWLQLK